MKTKIKSFDVFDTLIARRFINNDQILENIEQTLRIPNFVKFRKLADTGKRSIVDIYNFLVQSQVLTQTVADTAMELEYSLEILHTFPIAENIKKVNHGDLLISDMYLSAPMILEMVRRAGLDKQVTIYQSNRDKHTGKIWEKLKSSQLLHLGDNCQSDFNIPSSFGIESELYAGTAFTEIEENLVNNNFRNVALLTREVRLRLDHSFNNSDFLSAATQLNLPSLFLLCELITRKYPKKSIVFLGRDCQLLQKIYSAFYNRATSVYLPFSRKIAFSDPGLAIEYLSIHCPTNSILFDLNSTGTTWDLLGKIKKLDVGVAVFLNDQQYLNSAHSLPDTFSYITQNDQIIKNVMFEILNIADHGSISKLKKLADGVITADYDQIDVQSEIIQDIQKPVFQAISLCEFYKHQIREELALATTDQLTSLYRSLISSMSKMNKKLGPYLQPLLEKERTHIKELNSAILTTREIK
jgi:hypothetical protein